MSIHCRFCKGLIVPWKQMHNSCSRVVERLYADDQWRNDPAYRSTKASRQIGEDAHFDDAEWQRHQAEMRWKEEDKL